MKLKKLCSVASAVVIATTFVNGSLVKNQYISYGMDNNGGLTNTVEEIDMNLKPPTLMTPSSFERNTRIVIDKSQDVEGAVVGFYAFYTWNHIKKINGEWKAIDFDINNDAHHTLINVNRNEYHTEFVFSYIANTPKKEYFSRANLDDVYIVSYKDPNGKLSREVKKEFRNTMNNVVNIKGFDAIVKNKKALTKSEIENLRTELKKVNNDDFIKDIIVNKDLTKDDAIIVKFEDNSFEINPSSIMDKIVDETSIKKVEVNEKKSSESESSTSTTTPSNTVVEGESSTTTTTTTPSNTVVEGESSTTAPKENVLSNTESNNGENSPIEGGIIDYIVTIPKAVSEVVRIEPETGKEIKLESVEKTKSETGKEIKLESVEKTKPEKGKEINNGKISVSGVVRESNLEGTGNSIKRETGKIVKKEEKLVDKNNFLKDEKVSVYNVKINNVDNKINNININNKYEFNHIENIINGKNSIELSINASKFLYKNGSSNVIVVNKEKLSDVLTAIPFATRNSSPILYTDGNSLNKSVVEEIQRLGSKNITIIGGEKSVSKDIYHVLNRAGYSVNRIGGRDRYETNILLNQGMNNSGNQVAVVSGEDFPDALAISTYVVKNDMPIVLVKKNSIPNYAKSLINKIKNVGVKIFGGEKSVSNYIANELSSNNIAVDRLFGKDRYETSEKISDKLGYGNGVVISNGDNAEKTLIASLVSAKMNKPLTLVKNTKESKNNLNKKIDTVKKIIVE